MDKIREEEKKHATKKNEKNCGGKKLKRIMNFNSYTVIINWTTM